MQTSINIRPCQYIFLILGKKTSYLLLFFIYLLVLSDIEGNDMKKILLILVSLLVATPVNAQMAYEEEARALGIVAGQGMACGSAKYDTFELLARAIILTKSPSDALQNKALKIFTEEKADVFVTHQLNNFAGCDDVVRRFDNQDIFKITLYGDGTLKMADGQILTPRVPYDATKIYDKNLNVRQRASAIYGKDKTHVKKVEFKDASMEAGNQIKPSRAKGGVQKVLSTPKRISR